MKYRIRISYSEILIKIAFFLFFFFTFFPAGEPFPKTNQEVGVEGMSESNINNQIIKLTVFVLTLLASIYKFDEVISFIKKEKFLGLFLLWALMSILWSDFPLVSFKRWFQIFLIYFLIITFLTYFDEKEALRLLKMIIYPYLALTLLVVLIIPEAKDPDFNTWRGFAATKNNLGQISVITSVLSLLFATKEVNNLKKYIAYTFFLLAVIITLGTLSSTSYIALFVFLIGSLFFYLNKEVFAPLKGSNAIFFSLVLVILISFIIILLLIPEIPDLVQGIFGKSETFYDRGKLWNVMLWHISKHPIIGGGFQAFWTLENPQLLLLYQTFIWLPNQAHNGYLDLINELGLIGLILFSLIIVKYFIIIIKKSELRLWAWFVVLPIISNVTESMWFKTSDLNTMMFMLSYLLFFRKNELNRDAY